MLIYGGLAILLLILSIFLSVIFGLLSVFDKEE